MSALRNLIIGIAILATASAQYAFAQAPKKADSRSLDRAVPTADALVCSSRHDRARSSGHLQIH